MEIRLKRFVLFCYGLFFMAFHAWHFIFVQFNNFWQISQISYRCYFPGESTNNFCIVLCIGLTHRVASTPELVTKKVPVKPILIAGIAHIRVSKKPFVASRGIYPPNQNQSVSERYLAVACFHESDNISLEIAKQIEILTAGTKINTRYRKKYSLFFFFFFFFFFLLWLKTPDLLFLWWNIQYVGKIVVYKS